MAGLILLDVALGALALYLLRTLVRPRGLPLPPGPKRLPLIGNLIDLPKSHDWLHWAAHKDLYGPISSVTVFGQNIVILNEAKVAFDLLEKKSSLYSDRPAFHFAGDMCGWENALSMQHYGDRFRAYRKNIYQMMGSKNAITQFYTLKGIESRRFISRCFATPHRLQEHVRVLAGAIILRISHGYTIETKGPDPLVELADEALEQFSLSSQPGMWMVDILPILKYVPDWLPGTGFKRTARRWKKTLTELCEKPHALVKSQMAAGTAFPSFTSSLLEGNTDPAHEDIVKWAAASMYAGGADTTVSALYSLFNALIAFPEVQQKAQAEIDAVIGPDRLPTFADRADLPYIDACLKEVLRWHSVAPMGLPHVVMDDDVYQGYSIPKGSLLLPNIWLFNHDPATYKSPFTFNPSRFLGAKPETDPHTLAFGFGRRVCPGKELADSSLWLTMANVFATVVVEAPVDGEGREYVPEYEAMSGVICHPRKFECRIRPRSEKAKALVEAVHEEYPEGQSDAAALSSLKWQ